MSAVAEMLTVGEAAVVAGVEARVVNDAIDREIVPPALWTADLGRRIAPEGCLLVIFYDATGDRLTREERLRAIREVSSRVLIPAGRLPARPSGCSTEAKRWSAPLRRLLDQPLVVGSPDGAVSVDFRFFVERAATAAEDLEEAVAMVTEDPEVMGGQPCIRDTRIPVHDIAASLKAGIPVEEIVAAYPDLGPKDVRLAGLYARAHPPRGRPRRAAEVWPDAKPSFRGSVPRRRRAA